MHEKAKTLVSTRKAAEALGVTGNTLRRWAADHRIVCQLTPGGHRRFDISSMRSAPEPAEHLANFNHSLVTAPPPRQPKEQLGAIYCRVSSNKQKDDLERQIASVQERYPSHKVYTDIASGLNYKRKGLQRLLGHVQSGLVKEVVVAYKDRLARFGVELIEWVIHQAGATLVILDQGNQSEHKSTEQELAEDLLAVVHVFSYRANGKRKYRCTQQGRANGTFQGVQGPRCNGTSPKKARTRCATSGSRDATSKSPTLPDSPAALLAATVVQGCSRDLQSCHGPSTAA